MQLRIQGLPAAAFEPLFSLADEELQKRAAIRMRANATSRFPCRISLTDALPGQQVVLLNYEHHPVATPYRASFAIYVREGEHTYDEVDTIPEQLLKRSLALRAYDARGMLVGCDTCEGTLLASCAKRLLEPREAAYLHVHYAKPGCYAARIERA